MLNCHSSRIRTVVANALRIPFITALLTVVLGTTPIQPTQAETTAPDSTRAASCSTASAAPWWCPMPNEGLDYRVFALETIGSDLYVGGTFAQTADGALTLGHIARYDTAASTWNALPNQGFNDDVRAFALIGTDLYVAGYFTQTGDGTLTDLGGIARYDTVAGTWHALSNEGMDDAIYAMATVGSDLYVGGLFTKTGDGTLTNLGYIARYDTVVGTWHALPNQGLYGSVFALAVIGSNLYTGGTADRTGDGTLTNLGFIARYDTTANTWHALSNQGLSKDVNALTVSGSNLYAGGDFIQTGDGTVTNLNHIARYNTVANTWHALPNQGLDGTVGEMMVSDSDLYAGGGFTQTVDGTLTGLGYIARYDINATTWHALPNQGFNSNVYALAMVGDDLYAGGEFTTTSDYSLGGACHITRLGVCNQAYIPLAIKQ